LDKDDYCGDVVLFAALGADWAIFNVPHKIGDQEEAIWRKQHVLDKPGYEVPLVGDYYLDDFGFEEADVVGVFKFLEKLMPFLSKLMQLRDIEVAYY